MAVTAILLSQVDVGIAPLIAGKLRVPQAQRHKNLSCRPGIFAESPPKHPVSFIFSAESPSKLPFLG
jgi:hypothetical protein